jgi:hypothetical protein
VLRLERDLTGCLGRTPPPVGLSRELDLPRPAEHVPPVVLAARLSALGAASRARVAAAGTAGTATLSQKTMKFTLCRANCGRTAAWQFHP